MDIKNKTLVVLSLLFILVLSSLSLALKVNYAGSLTPKEIAIFNATILELNSSYDLSSIAEINILNSCHLYDIRFSDKEIQGKCSDRLGFAYSHYQGDANQYKINIYNARYQLENNLTLFVLLHELRHVQKFSMTADEVSKIVSPILEQEWNKKNYISTNEATEIDCDNYAKEQIKTIQPKLDLVIPTTTSTTTTTTIIQNTQPVITVKPQPTPQARQSFWQKIFNVF
jgi:hypothetical protein